MRRRGQSAAPVRRNDPRRLSRNRLLARSTVSSPVLAIPTYLKDAFHLLRRAYPAGVPGSDYDSLLLVVSEVVGEENLGVLIAELTRGNPIDVVNDAAAVHSVRRPGDVDIKRVRAHLAANGWPHELPPE